MAKHDKKPSESKQKKKDEKKAKQASKSEKKALKQAGISEQKDIETILKEMDAKASSATDKPAIVTIVTQPPRRAYSSFTPLPSGEVFVFGGECYDGQAVTVFNETFRWNPDKQEWKKIENAIAPKPRCSHQAVYYKDSVFVYGGEYATAEQFHHFKDLWRFDIKTNKWEELKTTGFNPGGRSGHRMINWRNYLIVFGGFFDTARETKYFNDVYVLSVPTLQWRRVELPLYALTPLARSACQVCLNPKTDTLFIYGGYCKVKNTSKNAQGKIFTDMWQLNLKPILSSTGISPIKNMVWEKVAKKGTPPPQRTGAAMTTHKNMAVSFGGVFDEDDGGLSMKSVFYNDLYAFDMDRKRWYQLTLRGGKSGPRRKRRQGGKHDGEVDGEADKAHEQGEDKGVHSEDEEDDWIVALQLLEELGDKEAIAQLYGYVEQDGKLVRVQMEDSELPPDMAKVQEMAAQELKANTGNVVLADQEQKTVKPSATVVGTEKEECPQLVSVEPVVEKKTLKQEEDVPLPRINAQVFIKSNLLYVYGGLVECGRKEVTLDDCWTIDLNSRAKWDLLLKGTINEQTWHEEEEEEGEESDFSDDDGSDDEEESEEEEEGEDEEEEEEGQKKKTKKGKKVQQKAKRVGDVREKIQELQALIFEKAKTLPTPNCGESLRQFFDRTKESWMQHAQTLVAEQVAEEQAAGGKGTVVNAKELRRMAFEASETLYDELLPIVEQLTELTTDE